MLKIESNIIFTHISTTKESKPSKNCWKAVSTYTHSLGNKVPDLETLMVKMNLEIMAITKTWLNKSDE